MRPLILAMGIVTLSTMTAAAQQAGPGSPVAVEFVAGWAGFVDDATRHHSLTGAGVRWYISPRVSLGPEVVYMRGPDHDRNLIATGNVTVDIREPRPGRRMMPFLVAGGGVFHHRAQFGTQTFSSSEGSFTAGAGVRLAVSNRWYVGGEWRVGWEPHSRVNVVIGVR